METMLINLSDFGSYSQIKVDIIKATFANFYLQLKETSIDTGTSIQWYSKV